MTETINRPFSINLLPLVSKRVFMRNYSYENVFPSGSFSCKSTHFKWQSLNEGSRKSVRFNHSGGLMQNVFVSAT